MGEKDQTTARNEVIYTNSLLTPSRRALPAICQFHPGHFDSGVIKEFSWGKEDQERGKHNSRRGRTPESNSVGLLFPTPLAPRGSLQHILSLKY